MRKLELEIKTETVKEEVEELQVSQNSGEIEKRKMSRQIRKKFVASLQVVHSLHFKNEMLFHKILTCNRDR